MENPVDQLRVLLRGKMLRPARKVAREWSQDHVERPLITALKVAAQVKTGKPYVLVLGESSYVNIAHDDTDLRRLGEMLGEGSPAPVVQFFGPGFSPGLYREAVRLLTAYAPPVGVVLPITIRSSTHAHVIEHPVFGYRHAIDRLERVRRAGPRMLTGVYKPKPAESEYRRFENLECDWRWGVCRTIGEYRGKLQGRAWLNGDDDVLRALYDYFHGEFSDGSRGLADWSALGRNLRALGAPVVTYRTWMPMERGVQLFGSEFESHVEHNFQLIEKHFLETLGEAEFVRLDPPGDELYGEPRDGTEHFNQRGRAAIVAALTSGMRRAFG